MADAARRDPEIGHGVIAELDHARGQAAADLAAALRDLMARPRPPLTAIAARD